MTMCTTRWRWRDDALCRIESRSRFRALMYLGLTDAYRVFHREPHRYTFWDYQAGRWHRDEGLRIDHLLLSPHAADRVAACEIDKKPAGQGTRLGPHADLVRAGGLAAAIIRSAILGSRRIGVTAAGAVLDGPPAGRGVRGGGA